MGAFIWIVCLLAAVAQSQRAPAERVVLLPSQDGKPSAVIITSAKGETRLDQPYLQANIDSSGTVTRSDGDSAAVRERYASTLQAMPQRAAVFVVYFESGTDQLVQDSQARLVQIKADMAQRPAPEVIVIGHTDTVDKPDFNDRLSLQRAETVKRILVEVGIPADSIVAQGRGERDLLVPTKDRVDEPRNRRVEIRVR
jgi:outer membrane protein OmpA-like peptidoglycan-associated protein